jgi:uncharacterized iron-regulated protein
MSLYRATRGARPRARGFAPARPRGRSSFRQQIVALHREIFRRNQQRINQSVLGYTPAFRRYEREYQRDVAGYRRRATFDELDAAIAESRLVYVGDYHTLPQAQRTFLRLMRRLPPDRPVTLALEFVQGRYQDSLDAYMAGRIDDAKFLSGIEHDAHWVFGGWPSFQPIFSLARERGYRIVGIDSLGRGPAGSSLEARDRYAARRIGAVANERPNDLVLVLIGELHIAAKHLPAQVQKLVPEARGMTIYQNCEEIYWALEAKGLEHDVELVQIGANRWGLMNTPPIVCQQSFLNWLSIDDEGMHLEAPEENFKEYVRLIASFFDLDVGDAVEDAEVATVVDLSFLQRLQRRGDFSAADMQKIRAQILRSESYYIPRARMIYLGNLSVNHASEEATHFVRHVCSRADEPRLLIDAFYARVLEEALGFLGSKLMNHKRKCAHIPYFERTLRTPGASRRDKSLARLVLLHARLASGKRVRGMSEVYECDAEMFNAVTHALGYQLGDKLYYALIDGSLEKSEIRPLFFDRFDEEGSTLATYLQLAARTRDVRIPDRF